jgi:hypothetical protein
MKRNLHLKLDETADFAANILLTVRMSQQPVAEIIGVPTSSLVNLATEYIKMYYEVNRGRSTFVDNSIHIH